MEEFTSLCAKKTDYKKRSRRIWELAIFAMLGTIMFCSKIVMEALPNIHLLGALTMTYTVVFRSKALIPIYVYVFINGLYAGFAHWWWGYTYIWAILWAITMLLPKKMPRAVKCIVYPIVCSLHGFAFGILYLPAEAFIYGLSFNDMIKWAVAGVGFDVLHGVGNLVAGILIVPLSEVLFKLTKKYQ